MSTQYLLDIGHVNVESYTFNCLDMTNNVDNKPSLDKIVINI